MYSFIKPVAKSCNGCESFCGNCWFHLKGHMEEAESTVSKEHDDKNTAFPLVTPQTKATGVIWGSGVDGVVNSQ